MLLIGWSVQGGLTLSQSHSRLMGGSDSPPSVLLLAVKAVFALSRS